MRATGEKKRGKPTHDGRTAAPPRHDHWPPADHQLLLELDDAWLPSAVETGRGAKSLLGSSLASTQDSGNPRALVRAAEVVRLHLRNTTRARTFRLRLPGASIKLVGLGVGRVEREEFVEEVVLVPYGRAVIDIVIEKPGEHRLEHRSPGRSVPILFFDVMRSEGPTRSRGVYDVLRTNSEFTDLRRDFAANLAREPDTIITTAAVLNGAVKGPIATRPEPKLRLTNDSTPRQPRQHLVRLTGGHWAELTRDGAPVRSLAWTDTLLLRAGEVVDVLLQAGSQASPALHVRAVETTAIAGTLLLDPSSRPPLDAP